MVFPSHKRSLWGDLYEVGEAYVFNGNTFDKDGKRVAAWDYRFGPDDGEKRLTVVGMMPDVLERRGIVTVAKGSAELNQTAKNYLGDR